MATKVHMEALSPTMEEGQIVQWLKGEGDKVSNGDVIAEIETDKATMELVARGDGVLRKILVQEGGTAPVGEMIGVIADEDEDISELVEGAGGDGEADADADGAEGDDAEGEKKKGDKKKGDKKKGGKKAKKTSEGDDGAEDEESPEDDEGDDDQDEADDDEAASIPDPTDLDDVPAGTSKERAGKGRDAGDGERQDPGSGRIKASPVARRLAGEEGIDLASIEGTGPGGRIVKSDVESAVSEGPRETRAEAPALEPLAPESGEEYEDVPLSQMRKTIAKRLVQSLGPVPHFFLTIDVDMSRAVEARERINRRLEKDGVKISYNDIILKATALALRRHPECNAHWGGDHVRRFNRVHLGVAVAIEDGLITPVIRDAHRKGLVRIAQEVRELAGRARQKKLKPDEYTGSTFSVSNLGMFGIEEFTAVINPPEAGILAVGAMEERPVAVDGELDIQPRMKITMSCDHRTIDGAMGSQFLQTLKGILEEPLTAFL